MMAPMRLAPPVIRTLGFMKSAKHIARLLETANARPGAILLGRARFTGLAAAQFAPVEMGEKVIINIKTFADGHRPPDQVVPGML